MNENWRPKTVGSLESMKANTAAYHTTAELTTMSDLARIGWVVSSPNEQQDSQEEQELPSYRTRSSLILKRIGQKREQTAKPKFK